ncbi:MAG: hypothetical protein SOI38_00700 [Eggerthellaceae bacterium]
MVMFSWHDQYRSGFREASYIQMYKSRKTLGAELVAAYQPVSLLTPSDIVLMICFGLLS